jgi:dihydrofolate reductase
VSLSIVLVAAVAKNGVIGARGELPWRVKADLQLFRRLTLGKPVIMGRRTFRSIGRPLDKRANIVITRDPQFAEEGVEVAYSMEEAMRRAEAAARRLGADEICVIGGGDIFAATIGRAERLHITSVALAPEGDAHFPDIDPQAWKEVHREALPRAEGDTADTVYLIYERR